MWLKQDPKIDLCFSPQSRPRNLTPWVFSNSFSMGYLNKLWLYSCVKKKTNKPPAVSLFSPEEHVSLQILLFSTIQKPSMQSGQLVLICCASGKCFDNFILLLSKWTNNSRHGRGCHSRKKPAVAGYFNCPYVPGSYCHCGYSCYNVLDDYISKGWWWCRSIKPRLRGGG